MWWRVKTCTLQLRWGARNTTTVAKERSPAEGAQIARKKPRKSQGMRKEEGERIKVKKSEAEVVPLFLEGTGSRGLGRGEGYITEDREDTDLH